MIVSQSIVQHGTIKLDRYSPFINLNHHGIRIINGHVYNFYPLGTPIFSTPFVFIANLFKISMLRYDSETQIFIATIVNSLIFMVLYFIARCCLKPLFSFLLISISFLGSTLTSTLATALWSHSYTVLFLSLILLQIMLFETGKLKNLNPYLIGLLAFAAYLTRPIGIVFAFVIFLYLFFKKTSLGMKAVIVFSSLMIAFIIFSFYEYNSLLPEYYDPFKMTGHFKLKNIYGVLLSPSRGLLVFSSFFIPILLLSAFFYKKIKEKSVFWLCIGTFFLQVILIAKGGPDWWGGYCFGPRLMTESIPVLIVLSVLVSKEALNMKFSFRALYISVLCLLGAFSIFIHTWQGLHNEYATYDFNTSPDIGTHTEYLYDWRYPQFLFGEKMFHKRELEILNKEIREKIYKSF